MLANGIDPSEARKDARRKLQLEEANSFSAVAREWFDARKKGWVSLYSDRIWRRIEADLFPIFGDQPINKIEPPELLSAIRKVEQRGAVVLAKRLLQVSGQIFRFAVASGRANTDPSQDLRGALRTGTPAKRRTALKSNQLKEFFRALNAYEGKRTTVLGLKLIMHTILRTNEVRFGRWEEIELGDEASPVWRIPAERMKTRMEHIVPLTQQVVDLLRELKSLAGESPHLFPAPTKEGVISQNTLIYALYRMGFHSRATVHGFRGTASTILNEKGFNRDWIERQLAHVERNDVRAAYNTAEWLVDRRKMLVGGPTISMLQSTAIALCRLRSCPRITMEAEIATSIFIGCVCDFTRWARAYSLLGVSSTRLGRQHWRITDGPSMCATGRREVTKLL